MDTPVFDMLKDYKNKKRISFAMPGHKGGQGLFDGFSSFSLDVTELSDTDNLYNPVGPVKKALENAKKFYKTDETFFLTNGSTGGILAMLRSVCSFGDTVLIARACHMSALNACALFGINPVIIEQKTVPEFEIPGGVNPKKVEELIKIHNPKAVLITSPNYYGICSDVAEISQVCHKYGVALLVDAAHGAHFNAGISGLPKAAILNGADMVVESAHKTLNAPNQAALLHLKSEIVKKEKVKEVYRMLQTSSPSYVLLSALDCAVCELAENGKKMWESVLKNTEYVRNSLSDKVKILDKSLVGKYDIYDIDLSRIVVSFCEYDTSGFEVLEKLCNDFNIDCEMADLYNVVCIAAPANKQEDFLRFCKGVEAICKGKKKRNKEDFFCRLPEIVQKKSPYEVFWTDSVKAVEFGDAEGKVSQKTVISYPPAMPVVLAGSVITKDAIEYIENYFKNGAEIIGLSEDNKILTVDI